MSDLDSYQDARPEQPAEGMLRLDAHIRSLTERVKRLEEELASEIKGLTLLCRAMWSLIEEATDLSTEDLRARIDESSAEGAELVQELVPVRIPCPHCGAIVPPDRDKCQFCGREV